MPNHQTNHHTADHQPRRRGNHGAGWLNRLLALLQGLLIGVALMVICWLAVAFPLANPNAKRMALPIKIDTSNALNLGPDSPSLTGLREARFQRSTRSARAVFDDAWAQWLYLLVGLLAFACGIWQLILLRRVLGSVTGGDPFSAANARILRLLGLILIAEEVVFEVLERLYNALVLTGVTIDGHRVLVDWNGDGALTWFVAGWIVLILSEVFRQGAALREEQSLTV